MPKNLQKLFLFRHTVNFHILTRIIMHSSCCTACLAACLMVLISSLITKSEVFSQKHCFINHQHRVTWQNTKLTSWFTHSLPVVDPWFFPWLTHSLPSVYLHFTHSLPMVLVYHSFLLLQFDLSRVCHDLGSEFVWNEK